MKESEDKQSLLERIQPFIGVTKNELIFSLVILSITAIALAVKIWQKPEDTFNTKLNKEIVHLFDSVSTADSIKRSMNPDTLVKFDSANILRPLLYQPEHEYKKKELPTSKININTASKSLLMQLPLVGEKMAEKIIDYRAIHPFQSCEDLMNVSGIGEKKLEKMKPYVIVK